MYTTPRKILTGISTCLCIIIIIYGIIHDFFSPKIKEFEELRRVEKYYFEHWHKSTTRLPPVLGSSHKYLQKYINFLKEYEGKCSAPSLKKDELETPVQIPDDDCAMPYVEITDGGRLGNVICQYMSLWIFKKHFGMRVVIRRRTSNILKKLFKNLTIPEGNEGCYSTTTSKANETFSTTYYRFSRSRKYLKLNQSKSAPLIKHQNFINQHPCAVEHISMHRDELRSEMQFKDELVNKVAKNLYEQLDEKYYRREDVTLVSVHVRRTDYVFYAEKENYTLPDHNYYITTMDHFRTRFDTVLFVVISDDKEWCKNHFTDDDVLFPGNGNITDPLFDFITMTLCDHHIIGYGTYAATSALLGKGSIAYGLSPATLTYPFIKSYLCSSPDIYTTIIL